MICPTGSTLAYSELSTWKKKKGEKKQQSDKREKTRNQDVKTEKRELSVHEVLGQTKPREILILISGQSKHLPQNGMGSLR